MNNSEKPLDMTAETTTILASKQASKQEAKSACSV